MYQTDHQGGQETPFSAATTATGVYNLFQQENLTWNQRMTNQIINHSSHHEMFLNPLDHVFMNPVSHVQSSHLDQSPKAPNPLISIPEDKRHRLRWVPQLHKQFVEVVEELGGPFVATPKTILERMNKTGLTRDQVKSHLQKFRQKLIQDNIIDLKNGEDPNQSRQLSSMNRIFTDEELMENEAWKNLSQFEPQPEPEPQPYNIFKSSLPYTTTMENIGTNVGNERLMSDLVLPAWNPVLPSFTSFDLLAPFDMPNYTYNDYNSNLFGGSVVGDGRNELINQEEDVTATYLNFDAIDNNMISGDFSGR